MNISERREKLIAKRATLLVEIEKYQKAREPGDRSDEVESLRSETMAAVNEYFHRRLTALPGIASYLDQVAQSGESH